jgi:hypothetical protein
MLGDDRGCLPKRQSNRNMLNWEMKSQRVLDRDQIRSVSLQLGKVSWCSPCLLVPSHCLLRLPLDGKTDLRRLYIDNCRLEDNKQLPIFVPVKEIVNAQCLLLVEISFIVLMREHLVFRQFISMLGLQVAFVALA